MKKTMFFVMALLLVCGSVSAQTVVSDTVRGESVVQPQPTDDHYRVVTNRFWDNWFVLEKSVRTPLPATMAAWATSAG